MLDIVANYYCIPFQEKLKNQNWENGKKTNFGADFGSFDPNLVPKSFFMGFTSTWYCYKLYKLSLNTISRKTKEPNLSKWQKSSFGSDFGPFGPNLSCFFFFFFFFSKIWLRQSLDIMVRYYHVHYRKKQMIQLWENLVMSRRADRLRDESDFIGPCPTNVER